MREITPKDFYDVDIAIRKEWDYNWDNYTRADHFEKYLSKLEIPFSKSEIRKEDGTKGVKFEGVYGGCKWSVENYDKRGTMIITYDEILLDDMDYYFPSEAIKIIADINENYGDKYSRLYNYDGCLCGQYVIPKSECDAEFMNLILEFLSDHEVDKSGTEEYMLMSSRQPFYNDDGQEYWVDCWVISDEYTY